VIFLKKYENEEYCAQELQSIDEMQYFEAEDYKSLELLGYRWIYVKQYY
jgi:hypothetical protein